MSSTEIARLIPAAVAAIATLLLTSAQLRIVNRPRPHRIAYVVAWTVCVAIVGGLMIALDAIVGMRGTSRAIANVATAGVVAALALGVGIWWTRREGWTARASGSRFLTLLLIHGAIVALVAYTFL